MLRYILFFICLTFLAVPTAKTAFSKGTRNTSPFIIPEPTVAQETCKENTPVGTYPEQAKPMNSISTGLQPSDTLRLASLSGVTILRASLSGATVQGVNLSGGTASGGTVTGLHLSGAHMRENDISFGTLAGGTLTGGYLQNDSISGVILEARLSGGRISKGTVSWGILNGSAVSGGTTTAMGYTGSVFTGGILSGATIKEASLSGAQLSEIVLLLTAGTDLENSCPVVNQQRNETGADSLQQDTVTTEKPGFFRRFIRYFADANSDPRDKKFDFSVIGGPHYSSDVKLGLGLVAAGTYSMDRSDLQTPLSNVALYGDITTSGFYLLGVRGNNIFPKERYRLDYQLSFFSMPTHFWGIGYRQGNNDDNESEYRHFQSQMRADFLFKIADNMFLGPSGGFHFVNATRFTDPQFIAGKPTITRYMSAGAIYVYDTRDFIPNAYRGLFLRLEQRAYFGISGSKPFYRTTFTFDWYKQLWKGGVLATDVYSELNYGNAIWTMLAELGDSHRMRGYYKGRYRDNNQVTAQIELRQNVYRRNGIAVWAGAGNVFESFDRYRWNQTLPNFGIGYRWEFKKRMNVRLDYGIGKSGQTGFIFNINEAF